MCDTFFIFWKIITMIRFFSALILCSVVLSGCVSTQDLAVPKVVEPPYETPLDQILKERPELRENLATVEIRQYFNNVEAPTVAEVKVTETGLLDDSLRSIRTIYSFRDISGRWARVDTREEYQCKRGKTKKSKNFQKTKCP